MGTLLLDDIGMGLLRQLHEADEAYQSVLNACSEPDVTGIDWGMAYGAYGERLQDRETLSEALLSHLLIIPSPSIDTSAYEHLWKESLKLTEDERENGKLWDAVEDISRLAIALYKQYAS